MMMSRKLLELGNHIRKIRGLDIETDEDKIELNIVIDLNLGELSARAIAKTLQKKIQTGLSYFTGMEIKNVNIKVNEIYL